MEQSLEHKIQKRYEEFRNHGLSVQQSLYLLKLMYELTPRGFEEYVRRYFYHVNGIKAKVIGGYTDQWVDIIWTYKQAPLLVQCKKRASWHIKKSQIVEFWYNVQHHPSYKPWTRAVLITTNRISKEAKKAAAELHISVRDYTHLLQWRDHYSLETFAHEVNYHKRYIKNIDLYLQEAVNHNTTFRTRLQSFFMEYVIS